MTSPPTRSDRALPVAPEPGRGGHRVPARPVIGALVAVLVATGAAGCSSSAPTTTTSTATTTSAPATTTTASTTTTTGPPATTTTAAALPGSPQPSAEGAATALVSSWSHGDRARALTVATADAVATLFAVPYPSGLALDRGCTSAFPPLICTFGPPGGGPTNAAIFQLYVSQAPGGWYVSSVRVET